MYEQQQQKMNEIFDAMILYNIKEEREGQRKHHRHHISVFFPNNDIKSVELLQSLSCCMYTIQYVTKPIN